MRSRIVITSLFTAALCLQPALAAHTFRTIVADGAIQQAAINYPASNNVAAQTLTFTKNRLSYTIPVLEGESSRAIAKAVNSYSEAAGVTAEATTTTKLRAYGCEGFVYLTLPMEHFSIYASITPDDLTNLANAINNATSIVADIDAADRDSCHSPE